MDDKCLRLFRAQLKNCSPGCSTAVCCGCFLLRDYGFHVGMSWEIEYTEKYSNRCREFFT